MRATLFFFTILISAQLANAQASSSAVDVITVYSQNEQFYLKSIPYDNEFPTLPGKTFVYKVGISEPLYFFDRGFDSVGKDSNNLVLSNDGALIFSVISWGANEEKEGLKSITVYNHGKIIRSFTEMAVNGCDKKRERCSLVYNNYDQVIDKEKSNSATTNYRRVFKEGVDEKEKFLSDFPIFNSGDAVYLTDSKRIIHSFSLKTGELLDSARFDDVFQKVKDKGRFNRVETIQYKAPLFFDFPKLRDGKDTNQRLEQILGMKRASISGTEDDDYRLYNFKIKSTISRDGTLEIEDIEFWGGELPKNKVIEFFKLNKFETSGIPPVFDKWHLRDSYFYFRNRNNAIARREKQQEIAENRRELVKRLVAETINGVYIPKDLGECFLELDKQLADVDKQEIKALSKRDEMIRYHMGLGMWLRNNWGLWGGSRLQIYFTEKSVRHPDDMSHVILVHYHDWVSGKKETWKDWEKAPHTATGKPKAQL